MNAASKIEAPGLPLLREPFPAHQISKLPKPLKRDSQKGKCQECGGYHALPAVHLDYVGHAALTDRLLDTDLEWSWEPVAYTPEGLPAFDRNGGLWIKLTVCGVTRLGYGSADGKQGGDAVKEIIGDALRNAAMRFGAALDLWHKGDLHLEEETAESGAGGDNSERQVSPTSTRDAPAKQPAHSALKSAIRTFVHDMEGCGDWDTWVALRDSKEGQAVITGCQEKLPDWWHGWPDQPDGFIPLSRRIEILEGNLANQIADYARV